MLVTAFSLQQILGILIPFRTVGFKIILLLVLLAGLYTKFSY
jgi:hypothetical protein